MSFILDLYGVQKLARALANANGLSVVYENIEQPRTDGKTIYVKNPSASWTDTEYTMWAFTVFHEIGHNVPEMRDCFDIPKEKGIDMQSFFGTVMNLLEDYRQEYFKYDEYLGKKSIMSKGRKEFLTKMYSKEPESVPPHIRETKEYKEAIKKYEMLKTLSGWETEVREDWMPDLLSMGEKLQKDFNGEQQKWLSKLKKGPYKELLNGIVTAEDTYNLTKKILSEVFELDADEEEKKAQESASSKGKGSSKEGKKGKKGKGESAVERHLKFDDVLAHKHDMEETSSYSPLTIDYEDSTKKYDKYNPWSFDKFDVRDYTTITTFTGGYDDISTETTNFSNKLKRYLLILSKDKYSYGKKKGYLHNKNLYRVTLKDAGSYSSKIFKQKKESYILDTAISVLIDMSGSMGGRKIMDAAHSAILLNDSIAKLGVSVEIAGFTEKTYGPIHYLFKSFDKKCEAEHLKARIQKGTKCMEENADGDSILFAYHRLKERKEKKKILIVLSDGQPAAYGGHGIYGFTQKVVDHIQKEGIVEIYGIGIQSNAVKQFYKQHCVINKSSELEETLLSVLREKLLTKGVN